MHCPVCKDSTLVMTERQGIEIDYCPQCRGVWLDRGELDKIIQRSLGNMADSAPPPQAAMQQPVQPAYQPAPNNMQAPIPPQYPPQHGHGAHGQYPNQHQQYPNQHQHDPRYHKRKKSFWEDLFD